LLHELSLSTSFLHTHTHTHLVSPTHTPALLRSRDDYDELGGEDGGEEGGPGRKGKRQKAQEKLLPTEDRFMRLSEMDSFLQVRACSWVWGGGCGCSARVRGTLVHACVDVGLAAAVAVGVGADGCGMNGG